MARHRDRRLNQQDERPAARGCCGVTPGGCTDAAGTAARGLARMRVRGCAQTHLVFPNGLGEAGLGFLVIALLVQLSLFIDVAQEDLVQKVGHRGCGGSVRARGTAGLAAESPAAE